MIRQRWKGLIAGVVGVAFIVGFLLHDLFPTPFASAAQAVVLAVCILFGGFFFLMFIFAYSIPLLALVTKGRKAAEYEWRRLWWIK
jgi:phosphoglycerol transferase MdoB-like AlkP superfamily enzyme